MPAFTTIGPAIVDKVTGVGDSGSSDESVDLSSGASPPSLNLAGKQKTALLITALGLAGKINPNGKAYNYFFNELQNHLENGESVDGFFEKFLSKFGVGTGPGSSSGSSSDSESSGTIGDVKDNIIEYLQGMMTNQGKENEINRQFNSAEAIKNREFQANEARIQREWYEAMSNSAYTRAVADMKRAGINPILAYAQGGAAASGTGIGAGSAAQYTATGGDTISSLLSSVADVLYAMNGASSTKVNNAFKLFKMAGKLA